jgi:two-component system copper resistance phosphate regulon response regulator CusR
MKILFVEDDAQLRSSLARGLREASYEVDEAADGASALSAATAGRYDAIILDVLLPERDGIAVCRELRERSNRVPILMLTALDAVEHRIVGLDAGADDYLTKPFDFGELLARLRALTRRSVEAPNGALTIGDLTIDTGRHRVRRGERDIPLTATEFAFLVYLARNAGRVVSRADLMANVWEDTRSTYSNIIDAYASRLRRKIDEGEAVPMFTTVRGSGYMLEDRAPAPRITEARAGGVKSDGRRQ